MLGARAHAVLREVALCEQHLAASAKATPAANGIDVDAQRPRSLQERRADGHTSATARRRKDDESVFHALRLRPTSRRPRDASPSAPATGCSRNFRIHCVQSGSWPIITSAARQHLTTSACSGLVIADVSPAPIAIVRNAVLMPSRCGRPKLTLDAPHVVL